MLNLKLSLVDDDDCQIAAVTVAQSEIEKLTDEGHRRLLAGMALKLVEAIRRSVAGEFGTVEGEMVV